MPVNCKSRALSNSLFRVNKFSVEAVDYICSTTRPDIPYTLYVGDTHLLLVPREVEHIHPKFPMRQTPTKRFRLQLSDLWLDEYKKISTEGEPMFSSRFVDFGLEDDEVVVVAWLQGTNLVPQWEFRKMFNGDYIHLVDCVDRPPDAKDSFGIMVFDLSKTAVRPS